MIEQELLRRSHAQRRFQTAPLMGERERYLNYLLAIGTSRRRIINIQSSLTHVTQFLNLTKLRNVHEREVDEAGQLWARRRSIQTGKKPSKSVACCSASTARNFLQFHGRLLPAVLPQRPFEEHLEDYANWMRSERGLAPSTVEKRKYATATFLRWVSKQYSDLSLVSLNDVDAFLECRRAGGCSITTLATECNILRRFFQYAGTQGWSKPSIARGIKSPTVPMYNGEHRGPTWKEVRRLLRQSRGDDPSALRTHAILCLCSIYALRSSEVAALCLSDFDWRDEILTVQRSKNGRIQQYPIQYEVGEAILKYLRFGRPSCSCRELFVTQYPPHRPINRGIIFGIVSRRMKELKIRSPRKGAHALRHACATQLLTGGFSLKEIADFLGHGDLQSVGVYAKYDGRALKEIAEFPLKGLLR